MAGLVTSSSSSSSFSTVTLCANVEDAESASSQEDRTFFHPEQIRQTNEDGVIEAAPFSDDCLEYDHYNGITMHLEKLLEHHFAKSETESNAEMQQEHFRRDLETALQLWRTEGRKGIWIHVPKTMSHLVAACMELGFEFHFVKDSNLVLSQWLPTKTKSKLPFGPTHQVGVGCVVLHPTDPTLCLVVQEQSGPAAARKLWKMPTGLLDPGEDVPEAAVRELKEETGLDAQLDGILCFRQAHRPSSSSDLFFVVQLSLSDPEHANQLVPQEDEIADIQWMPVEEFCAQETWQNSVLYKTLNVSIQQASLARVKQLGHKVDTVDGSTSDLEPLQSLIRYDKLPVGFSRGENGLYRCQNMD